MTSGKSFRANGLSFVIKPSDHYSETRFIFKTNYISVIFNWFTSETSYSVFSENRISSNVCANSPVTVHSSDSEASNNHSSISYKSPLISKENSSDSFQDDSTKVQDVISNRFEKKHGKQNYYQRVKDAIDWKDCSNSDCYSDEDSDKTTSNDPPFYLSQANQEGWINETSFEYDGPS